MTLRALERPAAAEPEGALVLLHGRGADEYDLVPLLDLLDPHRRLLGLTPRAPLALPPGGAHWYAVPCVGYPERDTFGASYAALSDWFDAVPFPPEQIVLGGFSQGAVMSLALGLGAGRPRPGAIVALSGFVPVVEGWKPDFASAPRVAIGHGVYDAVIPVAFARRARQQLEDAGAELLYGEYPLDHAIDPGFVAQAADWLTAPRER